MLSRKLTVVLCLVAGVACAAPVYTVTLPNGATNTLAEAFANGYVTSSEGAATAAGLNAAEDLRVTGGGRLEINEDLKSAGFAGEVHVLPGAVLRLTANGALGDTAHGTFVADGATLETECLDTSAQSRLAFKDEKLSFAGTGVDGVGALVARTPTTYERDGVWGGTILTMTGDATIAQVGQYQDFPNNSANNSLDMNGHTLTLCDTDNAGEFCFRAVIKNPGHIVIRNALVSMNDNANLAGDASNTLTITDTGRLDLYSSTTVGKKKWTLRVPATCMRPMVVQTSNNGGIWDGPIVVERGLVVGMQGQESNYNKSKLRGAITAEKAFAICRRTANPPQIPDVELYSPQNSFAQGLALTNINLKVMADGALPASMGTGILTANNVAFTFDTADREQVWSLPQMTVSGDVSIGDHAGSWAGIVKSTGATLTCSAESPSIATLDLEAGTMSLAEPSANFNAGLYEGWRAYAYWHKAAHDEFTDTMMNVYKANAHCDNADNNATNGVTLGVRLAYESQTFDDLVPNEYGTLVQANGYAVNYQGYIWNPDPTNVTWSFAASEETVSSLFINGTTVYGRQAATTTATENGGNADLKYGNATLRPGANTFWWRIGLSGRTVGPKVSVKTCATWTDKTKMGLVYDRQGRLSNNPDDYERLVETGNGALFTLTDPSTPAYAALKERTTVRRMERLSGTAGAVLDAPSRQLIVRMLKGCPEVKTASSWLAEAGLSVTETFVARAADLAAGHGVVTDGKLDFAEGATFALEGEFDALKGKTSVVATAAKGIQGLPVVTGDAAAQFRLVKSEDGKTLSLEYIPNGTLVIFR